MGSCGLLLGGLGVWVGCWGRHFCGLDLGPCYEVCGAWSERVWSNILAIIYVVDVPEAQQGQNSFYNQEFVERFGSCTQMCIVYL